MTCCTYFRTQFELQEEATRRKKPNVRAQIIESRIMKKVVHHKENYFPKSLSQNWFLLF